MSSSLLRPASFEERGAVVPFTTPELSLSRVRPDPREHLLLMMPTFGTEQGSAYVAPWRTVPEVARMSVHDRALHQEISLTQATTPDQIRLAALKIARTGLAGPAVADAARRAIETDRLRLIETHRRIAAALLAAHGLAEAGVPAGSARAKALLAMVGQKIGIGAAELQGRIELLARLLVAVGLKDMGETGRLRVLRERFLKFRLSMDEWAEFEPTDLSELGTFASAVAGSTMWQVDRVLGPLDKSLKDMPLVILEWAKRIKPVAQLVTRLAWLLDGWDFIFAFWEQVEEAPIEEQREAIVRVLRVLPLIPRNETDSDEDEFNQRYRQLQDRQPQSGADWRTSRQEIDQTSRIEAAKVKVMLT
jgi:hypothetical protein